MWWQVRAVIFVKMWWQVRAVIFVKMWWQVREVIFVKIRIIIFKINIYSLLQTTEITNYKLNINIE